jgi:transposase
MNREELLKLEKEELLEVLLSIIAQQAEKIAELEARLNMNSKNSSKPPSSDGFKRPKSMRTPSGKPSGGQKGHEGRGLKKMHAPDKCIIHEPEECISCPYVSQCDGTREICDTRYVIDIKIETKTTAHQIEKVTCPRLGLPLKGQFPGNIKSTMQYGENLEALAVSLNTVGMVSLKRTHEILSGVFDVPVSTGTIANMVSDCAKKVTPSVEEIKEAVVQEPLIHNDETGIRVDKKTFWAHVASTDKLTHIDVHEKRGKEGMNAIGIFLTFLGTAIHDCWAPYFSYDRIRHGLCNAHLLRELTAVWENTKQPWSQKLIDLLLAMKRTKEDFLLQGIAAVPPDILDTYTIKYDAILGEAITQNPVPPAKGKRKPKRGKTGALVNRLILRKEQYILFFTDFNVPFDNNQAERDFRMFKVKQKVSGCFRTVDGARDFAAISSYIGTARKHGVPAFRAIRDALLDKPFSILSFVD